jgi:UDP-3-O-[3-hydroxymyristoyl] N-acetylglucosamine deacetylase
MTFSRRTLRRAATLEGAGLHSGEAVRVTLAPAQEGIRFSFGSRMVAALPENVSETNRSTRLGEIGTVEHVMAALAGTEITDVDIVLTTPELPALDGSAAPYVQAIRDAGIETLGEREFPGLFSRIFLQEDDVKIAVSAGEGHWRYEFVCSGWPLQQVYETMDVCSDFDAGIAPARTFGFEKELPQIRAAGLAQGLDMEKALLLGENGYANEARFLDEPARHKLLDAIGDLYLSGVPIRTLNFVGERSGHRKNVEAARLLRQAAFGA